MAPRLQRIAYDPLQPVRVARLYDILEGAAFDGVDCMGDGTGRGDEDNGQRRVALLEPIEQIEPANLA